MDNEVDLTEIKAQLAKLSERSHNIANALARIEGKVDKNYVTKDEFRPVKNVVYGMVGIILVTTIGALLKLT